MKAGHFDEEATVQSDDLEIVYNALTTIPELFIPVQSPHDANEKVEA